MNGFERSEAWAARAGAVIPLGTQTLSKHHSQWVGRVHPSHVDHAVGARLWDVDGNEWLDEPMALGPILLGYAEPVVDDAIRAQLAKGITFTLLSPLEVEAAERIVALCPGVDQVRFAKSGSDAVSAAVRAARAHTGRDLVLVGGYHGWHDWYIGSTTRDKGVPAAVADLTHAFPYGDLDRLDHLLTELRGRVAAVVLEPSGATLPPEGYLQGVVDRCAADGVVSIFDEIITGFRLAPGGARERYGVHPDLSCYGKALGNGMPIAAVGGHRAIMAQFDEVFFSGTHGGEALSLAAAVAVLDTIADGTVLADIEARGRRLRAGLDALVTQHGLDGRVTVDGEPHRTVVGFAGPDPLLDKSFVQQGQAEAGCLFNGSLFLCARHTDADVQQILDGFAASFAVLATDPDVASLLRGSPVAAVFRAP